MGRKIRWIPDNSLVELTNRCIQGRFLLRPSEALNRLAIGVLVKALEQHDVYIHAITIMSNHWHLMATFPTTAVMVEVMRHFEANLSKEAGRLHGWPGTLWAGRYKHSVIDDDEATQISRLRYLLSQGVKEGLVWTPEDWPGVNSVRALVEGIPLEGCWISRTDQWAARRRKGADSSDEAHTERIELHLDPLPCLAHLPETVWRGRVAEVVKDIEAEARIRHLELQSQPLGARRVREMHPHHAPEHVDWSPQPLVIARDPRRRERLRKAYSSVISAFRDAASRLARGDITARFPEGTFPPRLPYVPTAADLLAGG